MRSLVRVTLAFLLSLSFLVVSLSSRPVGVAAQATPTTQSTQANEEVVRAFVEQVLSQGNMDLIDDLFTPDFVLHPTSDPAQDVQGQDGVMGFVMGGRAAFPDIVYTIDDLISEGDSVVVRWTNRGTHQGDFLGIPATGIPVSIGGSDVFHFEGGKLKEGWTFPDNLGLLVQLGVIPGGEQMATAVPAQSPIPAGVNPAATPAPADENRAMMERFWEVYNANDMDAFQSFFADDFVNFTPAPGFDPTAAGFAQTMSFFRAGFPDQQAVVNEIVVDGDMVVSRVTLQGTHEAYAFGLEATHRVVTYGGLEITRMRDGKFIEAWGFYDQVSILLQLGLIPGGAPPPATPVAAASPVGSPTAGARINWEAYSQLEVTGSEDGFTAPDSIAGGLVALTFENTGTTNHMAMLIRPKSGTTVDELEAAIKSDPLNQVIIREMVDLSGGAGGIAPGMRQRVIMPVEPGQYLLADFELADDGAPFVTKNGLKRLEVTPATGATPPEPPADVTVGMIDFVFTEIPSALTAGTYIIKVTADGTEPHELAFVKLAEGVSVQDAFAQAPQPGQPLPFTFWGGVQDIAPGTVAWIETEFSPGTYVAFCPIIDPDTNRQHLLLGMVHTITVE